MSIATTILMWMGEIIFLVIIFFVFLLMWFVSWASTIITEKNDEKNIAVLIDADNASAKFVREIFAESARYGKITIRKAYGNWKKPLGWENVLQEYAIQPVQQYDLTAGKNATDIAMAVDAMDILHSKDVDGFCLVSSDSDFTPLATYIISEGKKVIGFGERKTPGAFVNVCSTFLYLDEGQEKNSTQTNKDQGGKSDKISNDKLKQDTKLINLIRDAITGTKNEKGWALLSAVGLHISNQASFDPRNYGYSSLNKLIEAIDLFELRRNKTNNFEVRDSRKS